MIGKIFEGFVLVDEKCVIRIIKKIIYLLRSQRDIQSWESKEDAFTLLKR